MTGLFSRAATVVREAKERATPIGGPLADLLDLTERFVAAFPELDREHVDGEPCDGDYACGMVTHIRRIARALLAEETFGASQAAPTPEQGAPQC